MRLSFVDSEGVFKEELQKERIIKIGGLPPKALSGYVFLRMFKNLVRMLVYPLSLHTRGGKHTHLCEGSIWNKSPSLWTFSNFKRKNTRVAAGNFKSFFMCLIVTTRYRLFL